MSAHSWVDDPGFVVGFFFFFNQSLRMSGCYGYWGLRGTTESSYCIVLEDKAPHTSTEMWKYLYLLYLSGMVVFFKRSFLDFLRQDDWSLWVEWRDTSYHWLFWGLWLPHSRRKGKSTEVSQALLCSRPCGKLLVDLMSLPYVLVRGKDVSV